MFCLARGFTAAIIYIYIYIYIYMTCLLGVCRLVLLLTSTLIATQGKHASETVTALFSIEDGLGAGGQ